MAYGTIKVDNITFDNGGVDKLITVSGLFYSTSGALTVTGTISGGNVTAPTATFTTLTGTTTTGTTATFTSGSFTTLTGTTVTGTTANFVSGVFTTQISGATITGTTVATTTGSFVSLTGTTATFTSGIIASGTAALPSLAILSDPNTGIYSPGADQLAISTNGTGRLFVDASGNVILGATSILGGAGGRVLQIGNTSDASSTLQFAATTTGSSVIQFGDGGSPGSYAGYLQYTHTDNALVFATGSTERLRITSGGLVGIGTSSPSSKLEIGGATNGSALTFSCTSSNPATERLLASVDYKTGGVGSTTMFAAYSVAGFADNASTLRFYTDAGTGTQQERLRITGAGNVGIGTTSPQNVLHLAGSSPQLILDPGSGSTDPVSINSWRTNAPITFRPGDTERARIDGSGRLLVGTSSTTGNVRAVFSGWGSNPTQQGIVRIQRGSLPTSGQTIADVEFADDSNNLGAGLTAVAEANWASGTSHPSSLVFSTTADGAASPTERMRIGQSGALDAYSTPADAGISARVSHGAGTTYGLFSGKYSASSTATGTNSFYVYTNGNVVNTNNSYGALSDIKLKENIVDANSQWGDLKALQVRNYNFKEGQTHTQIGLVAQEAELVSPGLVYESPDRDAEGNDLGTVTKSVNYSVLYMKAVKALQEAMERIETLEASNADMLARLTALEAA